MTKKADQLEAVMPSCLNRFQRRRVPHVEPEEIAVHTKQEFLKDCDINEIMRRAKQGVTPTWLTSATPYYGDFSDLPQSLTEANAIITRAQESFLSLPLEMRRELDHDFRNLDSAPREIFERYGLLERKEDAEELAPSTDRAAESTRGSASRKAPAGAQGSRKRPDKASNDADPAEGED